MKYLTSAVNFSIKNWLLIIPLFVLTAIASLLGGAGAGLSLGSLSGIFGSGIPTDPGTLLNMLPTIMAAISGGGLLTFLAEFVHQPLTYGLVNKGLETGIAGLEDMGPALKTNFIKYVLYFVGELIVSVVLGAASFLLLLLLIILVPVLKALGLALVTLACIAIAIFMAVVFSLLSLWFSAMVIDSLDVVSAAKKSVEIVKGCFWTVFGISLLVGIAAAIVGGILSFINFIPVIGPVIYSVIPTVHAFLMIVFFMTVYREKTGRTANV